MVDTALLETLELLTPLEQNAMLAIAEYLKERVHIEAPLGELPAHGPRFRSPDESLSPARMAESSFMRENPALMGLLAQ